jgi:hypothetical protein
MPCEHVAVGVLEVRRRIQIEVGHGVEQELERDRRRPSVACAAGDDRGEVSPCAVAAHSHSPRVEVELVAVRGDPERHGLGVQDRCGERVFGGEAVGNRDDRDTRLARDRAAELIVAVEAADHPAAAVEVDEHSKRARPLRRCETNADRPRRTRHLSILNPSDLRLRYEEERRGLHLQPRLVWRKCILRQVPLHGELVEECLGLRVEGHRGSPRNQDPRL